MVIDTGCLGLTSFPINAMKVIIDKMSLNYCASMEKMYILNPSFGLKTTWNMIKSFVDPESIEKITMLKPKRYSELAQHIPVQFLQRKYGGKTPDIT